MNETGNAAREPEISREQQVLGDRLEFLDKSLEGLRGEVGQLESTLRIALRPYQDKPKQTETADKPERPLCLTPFGDSLRDKSEMVNLIARRLNDLSDQLRDIRDRCELPRLPDEVTSTRDDSYAAMKSEKR